MSPCREKLAVKAMYVSEQTDQYGRKTKPAIDILGRCLWPLGGKIEPTEVIEGKDN